MTLKDRMGGRPRFVGGLTYGTAGNDTLTICRICDMKISEMVEFLTQSRVHMQQGIFPDVQQMYLLHSALSFEEVSCKALIGAPLSPNEFLKLEQTFLADIVVEEEGNEHLRNDAHVTSPLNVDPPALSIKAGGIQVSERFLLGLEYVFVIQSFSSLSQFSVPSLLFFLFLSLSPFSLLCMWCLLPHLSLHWTPLCSSLSTFFLLPLSPVSLSSFSCSPAVWWNTLHASI